MFCLIKIIINEVAGLPRRVSNKIFDFCYRKMAFYTLLWHIYLLAITTTKRAVEGQNPERNFMIENLEENPGIYFQRDEDISFTKAT